MNEPLLVPWDDETVHELHAVFNVFLADAMRDGRGWDQCVALPEPVDGLMSVPGIAAAFFARGVMHAERFQRGEVA